MSDAEGMLRAAIAVGPWPVGELRVVLTEAGLSRWEIDRAVASLKGLGELVTVRQHYWVGADVWKVLNQKCGSSHCYIEGHSRAELIRRVASRTPRPSGQRTTTTDEFMQGEGAERLAREAFARGWQ